MGWSIHLKIDAGGPEPVALYSLLDWNYTYNVGPMLREAGFSICEMNGQLAGDCLPGLCRVVAEMESEPGRFKPLNPKNGWGDYDGLLVALRELIDAFKRAPKARVVVL